MISRECVFSFLDEETRQGVRAVTSLIADEIPVPKAVMDRQPQVPCSGFSEAKCRKNGGQVDGFRAVVKEVCFYSVVNDGS